MSCHGQNLTAMAVQAARTKRVQVNEASVCGAGEKASAIVVRLRAAIFAADGYARGNGRCGVFAVSDGR